MHSHSPSQKSSLLADVLTVGSLASPDSLEKISSLNFNNLCDVVEFRADAFPDRAGEVLEAMRSCPLPRLLTVRDPAEGGLNGLSFEKRLELLRFLLPAADLVDVELANFPDLGDFLTEAKARNVAVVGSFHDFAGTPEFSRLRELYETGRAAGADVVKVAATLRGARDLQPLAELLEATAAGEGPAVSVMGMGPLGRVSRLLFAKMGSVLNYGYLDEATVPGQWPARRLRELIQEL